MAMDKTKEVKFDEKKGSEEKEGKTEEKKEESDSSSSDEDNKDGKSPTGKNTSKGKKVKKTKRRKKRKRGKKPEIPPESCCCGHLHPPLPNFTPEPKRCMFYRHLASSFQFVTLFRVLDTEKRFLAADTDHSGWIDQDELETILTETIGKFSEKQLDKIFTEIDVDENGVLDFIEVLTVLDKIIQRQQTNLPSEAQQNYSKTCTIQ